MEFSNSITSLFSIRYPIIQAGMVWNSGWRLASAVSNAGGLGLIGSGSMYPDILREHIKKCRAATTHPFGVNIPLISPEIQKHIDIVIEEKIPIVFTSAGNPQAWTGVLKEKGIQVVHVVSSSRFARKAADAGCDAVVAEGFEAGGHNGREETTSMVLIPAVVDAVQIPVIAAGGFFDGRGLVAALAYGASGIAIAKTLVAYGVRDVVLVDRAGSVRNASLDVGDRFAIHDDRAGQYFTAKHQDGVRQYGFLVHAASW